MRRRRPWPRSEQGDTARERRAWVWAGGRRGQRGTREARPPDVGEGGWCGDDQSRKVRGKVAWEGGRGGRPRRAPSGGESHLDS